MEPYRGLDLRHRARGGHRSMMIVIAPGFAVRLGEDQIVLGTAGGPYSQGARPSVVRGTRRARPPPRPIALKVPSPTPEPR